MDNPQETPAEPIREYKADATRRLRREGRWDEAAEFRRQVRKGLCSQGMPKAEANEEAWQTMIRKFPPLPPTEPSPDVAAEGDLADLPEWRGDQQVDLVSDTLWVYQHLADKTVKPEDAPEPGAWALLQWSRQYKNKFFETLLPKALAAKEKRPDNADDEMVRRERRSLRQLAEELRGYWDELKHTSLDEFGLPE